MKKTYVQFVEGARSVEPYRFAGEERFALYVGIEPLYGGWLLATPVPTTLNSLEDAAMDCEELLNSIEKLSSYTDIWEELDDADNEYIADTLKEFGI